jgi:hypothetical protein
MKEGKPIWGIIGLAVVVVAVIVAVVVAIRHDRPSQIPRGEATIVLKTNGGVPYEWKYEIVDESIVEHVAENTKALDANDGGEVEETHTFRALKEGKTEIIFEYKNFADGTDDVYRTKKYEAKVDKDLKLIIEEIASEDSEEDLDD